MEAMTWMVVVTEVEAMETEVWVATVDVMVVACSTLAETTSRKQSRMRHRVRSK